MRGESEIAMSDILTITEKEKEETDALFKHRKSVSLTPKNARFFHSQGGLISLELTNEDGTKEIFERVVVLRAFPISNPDEFLAIREPDTSRLEGEEIGMIEDISIFDEETLKLLHEELDRRYFIPKITKINSVKEKFDYSYWDVKTDSGSVTFVMQNPFSNIRVLEDGRVFMNDIDGNCFEIADPKKLDTYSYRKIEVYL